MDWRCGHGNLGHVGHLIDLESGWMRNAKWSAGTRWTASSSASVWMGWRWRVQVSSVDVVMHVSDGREMWRWWWRPRDNPGVADRSRWLAHQKKMLIRLRRTGSLHTQRSVHSWLSGRVQVVGRRMRSLTLNPSELQELPSLILNDELVPPISFVFAN